MSFLVVESVTESEWDGSFESQRLLKQRKKNVKDCCAEKANMD